MKTIVLMGNPNVGKSVVFSRLTGVQVVTSNYPGTTVDVSRGTSCIGGQSFRIIDAPGTYSLEPSNKAEKVAGEILQTADLVINVIDATNLERNLYLTLQLLETKKPVLIALNMWDEARHTGIVIDVPRLESLLSVPVIPTVAVSGEGIKDLVSRFSQPVSYPGPHIPGDDERWVRIGEIIRQVQHVTHRHHSLADRLSDATIRPVTGIPIACLIILLAFWLVRLIGETLVTLIFVPLFELYRPWIMGLSTWLGPGFLQDFLIGRLFDGTIDFEQSLGVLTTGLFIVFGIVLPYIVAFFLVLALLEDSGYLPRLATLTDTLFHRLGMHGYGIVPVFLGLGCNVPGILATRALETRKQRFIAATLIAISVPCMAKTAMIFGILGPYGLRYILIVFLFLFVVYLTIGLILSRIMHGECPEIFLEIPPYRWPRFSMVMKKTWMRIVSFLTEALPFLFLGVLVINILYTTGFLAWFGTLMAPLVSGWLGLPKEASAALIAGFLRKDLAIGMLIPLGMTPDQLVIAVTTLMMFFPCVGTFVVLFRELGTLDLIKSIGIMAIAAFLAGGAMRVILLGV